MDIRKYITKKNVIIGAVAGTAIIGGIVALIVRHHKKKEIDEFLSEEEEAIAFNIQDSFFIECDFSHKPQPRCTRSRWRYWYCSGSLRTSMWPPAPAWPVQYQEQ